MLARCANHIYRALFGFLHGHVLDELQELAENPDETGDLLRPGLHRLPIGEFPLLRGLAPVLAGYGVTGALTCLAGVACIMSATRRVLARQPGGHPAGSW
jgi:hypothetical protein